MGISCLTTVLASFTVPYDIGGDSMSLLWLLPLLAAVALVYKALKLPVITANKFIREVVVLFGTILLVMALIAVGLYVVDRVITG
jgi:hypothetical protein